MVIRTLLCVVLLAGCSAESEQPAPAPEPVAASPSVDQDAVDAAAAQVQRYLDVWADHGLVAAGRFVVPEQRAAETDETFPVLAAGEVKSYEVQAWNGLDDFVLQVELDLDFDRNPMSWNRGDNTRFVTITPGDDGGYLLSFASSP